jgi:Protein of unknown function (DUF2637)
MSVRRFFSISSALIVAIIAAVASYSHMRHLAIQYGQDHLIATLLPVSVDGMLVVATIALGDGRRYRWSAWLAFWVGVVASVIANVLAAEPSAIARCISAWPAIAFLLVVEVITRGGRIRHVQEPALAGQVAGPPVASEPASEAATPPAIPAVEEPAPVAVPVTSAGDPTRLPASAIKLAKLRARRPATTQAEAVARTDLSQRTVERYWPVTHPVNSPVNGSAVPELVEHR